MDPRQHDVGAWEKLMAAECLVVEFRCPSTSVDTTMAKSVTPERAGTWDSLDIPASGVSVDAVKSYMSRLARKDMVSMLKGFWPSEAAELLGSVAAISALSSRMLSWKLSWKLSEPDADGVDIDEPLGFAAIVFSPLLVRELGDDARDCLRALVAPFPRLDLA